MGYCVFVGGNLVSWKRQSVISQSSAKSEYRAAAIWLHQLLMEVSIETPVLAKLRCDNQTALHIAFNPVVHERTNHIEIDCHFIHEKI